MKKVAVIGATGYVGQELIRLLIQHAHVNLHKAVSQSSAGKLFSWSYPNMAGLTDLVCSAQDIEKIAASVDLVFLALPHSQAASQVTFDLIKKCLVIDLSADFRLRNAADYELWYGLQHPNSDLLKTSVYGLPELNREQIATSRLIANPGCYATCSILTLFPLLQSGLIDQDSIIIDAKSGVSGAGRTPALECHFDECNESVKAYKVASHRHTPEIEQELSDKAGTSIQISFTPHLVPMNRGILVTAYASVKKSINDQDLFNLYSSCYKNEPFIRVFHPDTDGYRLPETRWVKGSNFCDIAAVSDKRTKRVIAIGAIDNLVKGAAGQAIQNMNILFGFDESTGLRQPPIFPA